jgi:hypothetical protein
MRYKLLNYYKNYSIQDKRKSIHTYTFESCKKTFKKILNEIAGRKNVSGCSENLEKIK